MSDPSVTGFGLSSVLDDDLFVSFDIETTMNAPESIGKGLFAWPSNEVVLVGIGYKHDQVYMVRKPSVSLTDALWHNLAEDYPYSYIAGCNISFDMLYMFKESPKAKRYIQERKLWDIQIVEYLITGQQHKFASLDELSIKYGYPIKDASVKEEYFGKGLGADHVPVKILEEYLKGDLLNTLWIARRQYHVVKSMHLLTLVDSQMKALQAVIEMMFNGLKVNEVELTNYTSVILDQYTKAKTTLESLSTGVTNIDSSDQWSKFFFGGSRKEKVRVPDGFYKNGKPKFKTEEHEIILPPASTYIPDEEKVSKKTGKVSVDEDVLGDIATWDTVAGHPGSAKTASLLLEYRTLTKQLNTYVLGLGKHVIGGYIHGSINMAATGTGRLSSSNPNLQNISNNEIKKIFVSRFKEGVLVEVDFAQLEIYGLACITRDKQLIKDLMSGVDIHSALYEDLYGRKPTKEERKPFKSRTFQLIYGAGPKAIAKQAKCSIEEAKRFVTAFYSRYEGVKKWHTDQLGMAETYGTHETVGGEKELKRTFTYHAPTGRILKFQEYKNDFEWSTKDYSFSPTELKNYPVQSLATGDIVPMMLGHLFEKYKLIPDKVVMINTIHDSILFDVQADFAVPFMEDVLDELRKTHQRFLDVFGLTLPVEFNASASFGFDWFNMEETKL